MSSCADPQDRAILGDASAILERMGDAFYALDADWRVVYANRRALEFWRLDPEAVIGRVVWEALPRLVGTLNEAVLRQASAEQRTVTFEARSPVTGSWVSVSVCPSGGGVCVYWRDVTERVARERAVREDAERLRLAMSAGGLATWEFDLRTGTRTWSPEAAKMHGFAPETTTTEAEEWACIVHPDDLARVSGEFAQAINGSGDYAAEYRFRRPDGEIRWTAVHSTLLRDAGGAPQRMIGVLQDITERKRVEEMLREREQLLRERVRQEVAAREEAQTRAAQGERLQALGQLAGGIAHDFNNVLQSIEGGASLIARRANDAADVRRLAGIVLDSAMRGASITRRLLAFARRDDLKAEPLNPIELLDGMREILAAALDATIQLRVEAPPELPAMLADRGQLETALVNLATNARDAMPKGGMLVLSATADLVAADQARAHPAGLAPGSYLRLGVVDSGEGMDEPTLARVTEPFFTTKPAGRGTGLGLPMVKGFAEQSGGGLLIESEPGCGTRISLWLPQAAGPARHDTDTDPAGGRATAASVLLVDDEPMVRELLAAQLEDLGYRVLVAEDGERALAVLDAEGQVDVLVTDLSMPGMNGLSLIRAVQWQQPHLPAVLLTGHAGDRASLAITGAIGGRFSLLRKPASAEQLSERIAALLARVSRRAG